MKIRDSMDIINGVNNVFNFDEISIVDTYNKELFSVSLESEGELRISVAGVTKVGQVIVSDELLISPKASNVILVSRKPYQNRD